MRCYKCPCCTRRLVDSPGRLTAEVYKGQSEEELDCVIKCKHCKRQVAIRFDGK